MPPPRKLIYDCRHIHHGWGKCTLTRTSAVALAVAVAAFGVAPPVADPAHALPPSAASPPDREGREAHRAVTYSLERAVTDVRRDGAGRILSARTVRRDDGGFSHHIKVLTPQGRVVVIRIDARSGKRLE